MLSPRNRRRRMRHITAAILRRGPSWRRSARLVNIVKEADKRLVLNVLFLLAFHGPVNGHQGGRGRTRFGSDEGPSSSSSSSATPAPATAVATSPPLHSRRPGFEGLPPPLVRLPRDSPPRLSDHGVTPLSRFVPYSTASRTRHLSGKNGK